MRVSVHFYSYFKDLTGSAEVAHELPPGSTLNDLYHALMLKFPRLTAMEKSTLIAVGVDYQPRNYVLKDGDQVSLFPPVQGG